jgi:hypothetical protein
MSLQGISPAAALLFAISCGAPEAPHHETQAAPPPRLAEAVRAVIDDAAGVQGTYIEGENVYRITFPRSDVPTSIDGLQFHPFLGMTSWAAFTPIDGERVMAMGDLTLFEDEVNPVMSAALGNGLEVTALHNHFFFDRPRVMFMHIGGDGRAEDLARAVKVSMDKVREIRAAAPTPADGFGGPPPPQRNAISKEPLDEILGVQGDLSDGMYKAAVGRTAKMHGVQAGNAMGVNTWFAFSGTDAQAIVDGDFAMHESEVQPVLKALRAAGINIVAIHNHMTHEEPRFVFLHYWGKGPAEELARGLRSALELLGG